MYFSFNQLTINFFLLTQLFLFFQVTDYHITMVNRLVLLIVIETHFKVLIVRCDIAGVGGTGIVPSQT